MTRRRMLLLGVAFLLSLSALLAIAILLVGRFGSVEGRILGSTALLAGYGLVALPAVVLLDKERARVLALTAAAAAALAAVVALAAIWSGADSDALGRTVASTTIVALALAQVSIVTARRNVRDPSSVRRLFESSCATAAVATVAALAIVWTEPDSSLGARLLGALVVLDLLLVALQPILARARPGSAVRAFTVVLDTGESVHLEAAGADLAAAAAAAIRTVERSGGTILSLRVESSTSG